MARRPKLNISKTHQLTKNKQGQNFQSDNSDAEETWYRDVQISITISAILLGIYVKCLFPSLPGGDSGELILAAYEGGVAHPPGYPLFTLLSKLFLWLIPGSSPAYKINLLTAACSAAAGGFLQFTVLRITGCVGSSLLSVALFCINRLTWTWSVSAEVFSLNNLFVAVLLMLAVLFEADDDPQHVKKITYIGAFVCGLALCNQHTILIYVICIAFWVLLRLLKFRMLTIWMSVKLLGLFILGLLPYVYLPISTYINTARWTWGDQMSIEGFLTHFLRREYGTFDLGKNQDGSGFWIFMQSYWDHIHYNFCELGPFLALVGVAVAYIWRLRGEGTSVFVFFIMFCFYIFFFAWRANLDINNPLFKGVVERFWMQADIVLALLAGVGFHIAVRLLTERLLGPKQLPMSSIFAMMGAGIIILLQMKNFVLCDQSNNRVVHDFAKLLLDKMPRNALILTKGDLPSNTMRYFHFCENIRPDLTLLDVEVMSYPWFIPMMGKFFTRITFPGQQWQLTNAQLPDGRRTFNFRAFLEKNNKFPIMACIGMQERDDSWKESFYLLPYGSCKQVMSHTVKFDPVRWANKTGDIADRWTYRHNDPSLAEESWEKVANDEMWQAKISSAFFMYAEGLKDHDSQTQAQLLIQSYELYFRAIKASQIPGRLVTKASFPSFWYKNFALSCEKLLHHDHDIDKSKLIKLAVSNFKQYIHMEPGDSDVEKIEEAIESLTVRLDTIQKMDQVDQHLERMANRVEKMGVSDLLGAS